MGDLQILQLAMIGVNTRINELAKRNVQSINDTGHGSDLICMQINDLHGQYNRLQELISIEEQKNRF